MNPKEQNSNDILDDRNNLDEELPLSRVIYLAINMSSYHASETGYEYDRGDISVASASTDFSNYTQDNSMEVDNISQDDVILENDQRDIFRTRPERNISPYLFVGRSNNTWIFNNINNENRLNNEPLNRSQITQMYDMEELQNTSENTEYSYYLEPQTALQDLQTYEHEELQSTSETSDNDDKMDQSIAEPMEESWEPDICLICLEIMLVHGCCRTLRCGHTFHKRCISKWFKVVVNCPACRNTKV